MRRDGCYLQIGFIAADDNAYVLSGKVSGVFDPLLDGLEGLAAGEVKNNYYSESSSVVGASN
jgi:hypothetical protein